MTSTDFIAEVHTDLIAVQRSARLEGGEQW